MLKKIVIGLFVITLFCGCTPENKVANQYITPKCITSQSVCQVQSRFGEVTIKFDVEKVTTENSFHIYFEGLSSTEYTIDGYLEGRDMFMGKIPLFFKRNNSFSFITETLLGSCTENKMIWVMNLSLTKISSLDGENEQRLQDSLRVEFESTRH